MIDRIVFYKYVMMMGGKIGWCEPRVVEWVVMVIYFLAVDLKIP